MIQLSGVQDVDGILSIVNKTIKLMELEDNPQWSTDYPARLDFINDIASGSLYCCKKADSLVGFICVNEDGAPEYEELVWSEGKYNVIHRMAVDPRFRRDGIGSGLINFAEELSRKNGCEFLRTDTFSENRAMNSLFVKRGFIKTGEVFFENISRPFYCYEKKVGCLRSR